VLQQALRELFVISWRLEGQGVVLRRHRQKEWLEFRIELQMNVPVIGCKAIIFESSLVLRSIPITKALISKLVSDM
jgi:hypothetical protein